MVVVPTNVNQIFGCLILMNVFGQIWKPKGCIPKPRGRHTMTQYKDMVIIYGGADQQHNSLNDLTMFIIKKTNLFQLVG